MSKLPPVIALTRSAMNSAAPKMVSSERGNELASRQRTVLPVWTAGAPSFAVVV